LFTVKSTLDRRPATEVDIPFLLALRRKTMDPHLSASGASTSESDHRSRLMYRFECAEVLQQNGLPVGLLKVARDGSEWQIIQIQLVPELQGKGLGAELLADIVSEAVAAEATLSLTVLKANPARVLYERFGFVVVGESEYQYNMHRRA
jgi:ribosomal protein S18 acetylase RimI-like enzyme